LPCDACLPCGGQGLEGATGGAGLPRAPAPWGPGRAAGRRRPRRSWPGRRGLAAWLPGGDAGRPAGTVATSGAMTMPMSSTRSTPPASRLNMAPDASGVIPGPGCRDRASTKSQGGVSRV